MPFSALVGECVLCLPGVAPRAREPPSRVRRAPPPVSVLFCVKFSGGESYGRAASALVFGQPFGQAPLYFIFPAGLLELPGVLCVRLLACGPPGFRVIVARAADK